MEEIKFRAVLGSKELCKFAGDPWTGELLGSICCPKCSQFLDYAFFNKKAYCCRMIWYYLKYWWGDLREKLPYITTKCGEHGSFGEYAKKKESQVSQTLAPSN